MKTVTDILLILLLATASTTFSLFVIHFLIDPVVKIFSIESLILSYIITNGFYFLDKNRNRKKLLWISLGYPVMFTFLNYFIRP
jgi:predicted transcriptional regulator